MNSRVCAQPQFRDLFSTVLVIVGQLLLLVFSLLQSEGGKVLYRLQEPNEAGSYYIQMDICRPLVTAVLILVVAEIILAGISYTKSLYMCRISLPVCSLIFLGMLVQAYLVPQFFRGYLLRLLVGVIFGILAFLLCFLKAPDYTTYKNLCILMIGLSLASAVIGVFNMKGGNGSWAFGIQPGEFLKLCILVLACVGVEHFREEKEGRKTLKLFGLASVVAVLSVLIVRDLGNCIILYSMCLFVLLLLGYRKGFLLGVTVVVVGILGYTLISETGLFSAICYRLVPRMSQSLFYPLFHYLSPENMGEFAAIDSETTKTLIASANQTLRHAVLSLVRGGALGTGCGPESIYASRTPCTYTDFSFVGGTAVFGFGFALLFLISVLGLTMSTTVTQKNSGLRFIAQYRSNIIICLLLCQSLIHVLGSLSLIPETGVTLPFVSYGGSSTIVSFAAVAALLSIHLPDTARQKAAACLNSITISKAFAKVFAKTFAVDWAARMIPLLRNRGKRFRAKVQPLLTRHRPFRRIIACLLCLAIGIWVLNLCCRPSREEEQGMTRRDNIYTALVAVKDFTSNSTDSLLVVTLDLKGKSVNILSIYRDTLVDIPADIKKINSVYGRYGIDGLKEQVKQLVGYAPDCYAVVELTAIADMVDALGGVDVEVPCDMDYDDPAQDLHIHFTQGLQHLNGSDTVEVLRWRKNNGQNPADTDGSDIGRTQRTASILKSIALQSFTLKNVPKIPALINAVTTNMETDLSTANMAWFMTKILAGGYKIEQEALPAHPGSYWSNTYHNFQSYMIPEESEIIKLVNTEGFNPFKEEITAERLHILTE